MEKIIQWMEIAVHRLFAHRREHGDPSNRMGRVQAWCIYVCLTKYLVNGEQPMAISNATLAGLDRTQLLEMHYKMALLRRFEEKSAEEYTRGKIGGFMHLYIGQEAVGIGAITALRAEDKILSSYREHGHALAKGMEPRAVMAELYGKATGCSKGKGGSMHMFSAEKRLYGGQAIV